MSVAIDQLALPQEELRELTGYARPSKQLEALKSLGIPARRRPDNTVLVLRMHMIHPVPMQVHASGPSTAPKLKSSRK